MAAEFEEFAKLVSVYLARAVCAGCPGPAGRGSSSGTSGPSRSPRPRTTWW